MDFLSKLLQGIAFVPAVVNGIEGLFGNRSGAEKKDAAMSFVQAALSLSDALTNRQVVDEANFKEGLSKVIDGIDLGKGQLVAGPPPCVSGCLMAG